MELPDGRLGLIDFGQTRRLTDTERLALARVVEALGTQADPVVVAESMQAAGFIAEDNADHAMWTKYATLFFDSDLESQRLGFPTPQLYFVSLMEENALTEILDAFGERNYFSTRCANPPKPCCILTSPTRLQSLLHE